MKIHLRQVPQGGTVHFEETLDPCVLGLEEAGAVPTGPLLCSLDVGISDGGLFATGRVSVPVRLQCVACLREFEKELSVPEFATQIELTGPETVDLTPEIREDILLVLPSHPRCDADGLTECPAKFRSTPNKAAPDEPAAPSAAWDVLDQWKPNE